MWRTFVAKDKKGMYLQDLPQGLISKGHGIVNTDIWIFF